MSSRIVRGAGNMKTVMFDPLGSLGANANGANDSNGEPDHHELLQGASEQAAQIVGEAQERARQIEQDAYRSGYSQGQEQVRLEIAGAVEVIRSVAEGALQEKRRLIGNIESSIVELSLQIAAKIIDAEVALDPSIVATIAKKALSLAGEREQVRVRVNPDDVEIMRAHKDDLMASIDGVRKVEVVADRRVSRGGCILETAAGNVDARIQSQLSHVEQSMREVVGNE